MTNKELAELANELRTQNNRITAEPLYVVQQRRRIRGMDSAYADEYEWYHPNDPGCTYSDGEMEEVIRGELEERHGPSVSDVDWIYEQCPSPCDHGYEKVYYVEYWDFVTAHFTERAAELYLRQNRHNLNDPRVYVTSQYRCWEWNAVVEHLRSQ
jgi:hypothetical protein